MSTPGLAGHAAALALALAGLLPVAGRAAPATACHCYQDRSFDPARPAAADPYILATTRSSLLSAAFGVDKRSLVSAVMTGTAAEDLWVASWAGARTGRPSAAAPWRARRALCPILCVPLCRPGDRVEVGSDRV